MQLGHRARVGMEHDLDAALLQVADVGLPVFEVVGDEHDLAARLDHELQHRERAHRSGVLVGRQHAGFDHQHPKARPAVALGPGHEPVGPVVGELGRPLRLELRPVGHLVLLDPAALVGAGGLALEVDDPGRRLVVDAAACGAHGEGEVGVLVIRRRVALVEAAELAEERRRHREAGARAVVHLPQVVVLGPVGVAVAAVVPRGAVAPDDAARLLQPAVRIDELGADQAGVRVAREDLAQRVEPALGDQRVVVEEHQPFAARERRRAVAGAQEAQVLGVALDPHAAHAREVAGRGIGRRVVEDDHLVGAWRRVRGDALQAAEGQERLAVDGDQDRHRGRRVRRGQFEGRDHRLEAERLDRLRPEPRRPDELDPQPAGQRPRTLVAQDRPREARLPARAGDADALRAQRGGAHLEPMHHRAQRRRHPPARRRLQGVDPRPRGGEHRLQPLDRALQLRAARATRPRARSRARGRRPRARGRRSRVGSRARQRRRGGRTRAAPPPGRTGRLPRRARRASSASRRQRAERRTGRGAVQGAPGPSRPPAAAIGAT